MCFCELIVFIWVCLFVCVLVCFRFMNVCLACLCLFCVFVCMHLMCMCISLCSCVVDFVYMHFVVFVCGGVCVLAIINWNCSHQGARQTLVRCSMHQSLLLFFRNKKSDWSHEIPDNPTPPLPSFGNSCLQFSPPFWLVFFLWEVFPVVCLH